MKGFSGVDFERVMKPELAKQVRDLNKSIKSIIKYYPKDCMKILQEAMLEFKVCNIIRWLFVETVKIKEEGEVLHNLLILLVNLTAFYGNDFLKNSCDSHFLESLIGLLEGTDKSQLYASMVLVNVIIEDHSLFIAVTKNGFFSRLTHALVKSPLENKGHLMVLTQHYLSLVLKNKLSELIKNVSFG